MRILFIISLLLSVSPAWADILGAARVIDGDTLHIGATRIRLHGIDAPEAGQTCLAADGTPFACGAVATQALTRLIGGATVSCTPRDTDRYGRIVARCTATGRDLGRAMVAAGMATAYRRYSTDYVGEEGAAQRRELGLWTAQMQNPAAFRAAQVAAPTQPATCAIKGNISASGQIYHLPGQVHYTATRISTAKGERWFCSEDQARAAGWRPARR